jgi:quinate dehydrogenase (quinone)
MYTPPSEKPYIEWPSLLGGMNWGGITIDERTGRCLLTICVCR